MMPGPVCYLIYSGLQHSDLCVSLGLYVERSNIAVILATFAFTMLGFLAAVITILFSFPASRKLRRYRSRGHLDTFFWMYFLAIANLILTFILALLSFSSEVGVWGMRLSVMSTVNNVIQIGLIALIITNLCRVAMQESA